MTYRGHIENGKVVLDDGVDLPDGTPVDVRPSKGAKRSKSKATVTKGLLALAGRAEGLPPDAARNLDHYLYGHPKR